MIGWLWNFLHCLSRDMLIPEELRPKQKMVVPSALDLLFGGNNRPQVTEDSSDVRCHLFISTAMFLIASVELNTINILVMIVYFLVVHLYIHHPRNY